MEKKIYWWMAIGAILIFAASFFTPGDPVDKADLPWHIEHPSPDTTRVFGLTLNQSNSNEAEQHFEEEAKINLFKSPEGSLVAESFFEQVNLAGLRARVVLTIAVPDEELRGMYERGARMSSAMSGKKITPAPEDVARLRTLPVSSLTYMPGVRLDEEIILKRFGSPARRMREKESGAVHWLYPQHGLDITPGGEEKPVFQYVLPGNFDRLIQPLLTGGEEITQ